MRALVELVVSSILPRALPHLDSILSSGRDNFAAVKLQRGHSVVILDRFKDTAGAQVPDLNKMEQRV